ncbi:GtrA family protein [Secundilactobacillus malefermentans]|uniref:GtrA family protein n=2 Tax=Secundilactobacillus malefermentans TaxID=176292 RepID=UPI000975A836
MDNLKSLWYKYHDIITYVFFGGITTLVNIVVFDLCNYVMNYQIANIIAWFASVIVAYVTNKLWVFNSHYDNWNAVFKELFLFFGLRIASLVLDQAIMTVGISLLGWDALLVKILDQVVVIASNYIFSKYFIFKSKKMNAKNRRSFFYFKYFAKNSGSCDVRISGPSSVMTKVCSY